MGIDNHSIAVVIPAYKAADTVERLVSQIPDYVDFIIIVNDASPDSLEEAVSRILDPRVIYLCHEKNQGVGGAMVTGFRQALELGADLIAKIDADDQMDPQYLDRFARIAIRHHCDYVKANRFGHIEALPSMPKIRMIGSLALTFLSKFASGYWNVFDPQNGYVMISRRILRRLDLDKLNKGYFFENSMLINLNIIRARIGEIYLPAHYGDEISSMKLWRIILTFPGLLLQGFLYRVYQKYIFRSISPYALFLFFGVLLMGWGTLWGALAWHRSCITGVPSTTGTVVLALLPLLLGFALILQAIVLDVLDAGSCIIFDYDDESLLPPYKKAPANGKRRENPKGRGRQ